MSDNIILSRCDFEKLGDIYPPAENVTIEKVIFENIDCYWFRYNDDLNSNKIAVYLHGGCYVFGSMHSHKALVSNFAKDLALPFLLIEYGLAPEKPYPNAINDVLSVYRHLLSRYPDNEIILMGDSAGAGLCVALLSKVNEYGLRAPEYMIMISPWIDLSCSNSSMTLNADKDPVLQKERLLELASLYTGNQNLSDINPTVNLPDKFPPTLILIGSDEILLDDSKFIYNKAISTQAKTKLSIYEKQSPVWLLENINTEQSQKAIREIKTFIEESI
jgi:monoterpene epsilon-lactone hydrolase